MTRHELITELAPRDKTAHALNLLRDLWPLHNGPAHIVLADCNLDNGSIAWCIKEIDAGRTYSDLPADYPVFAATRAVLTYMLGIPEADRVEFANSGAFYLLYEWGP